MSPPRRRFAAPACLDNLERRQLLAASPTQTADLARLHLDLRAVQADIARMQLTSHVTPAEVQRVAVDTRLATESAGPKAAIDPGTIRRNVIDLEYDITHAFLHSYYTDQNWSNAEKAIGAEYAALNVPVSTANLDRLTTDLRAVAQSAGVTRAEVSQMLADDDAVFTDRDRLAATHPKGLMRQAAVGDATDPVDFFEHHLSGFVATRHYKIDLSTWHTHASATAAR